jgi:hypothetical protein
LGGGRLASAHSSPSSKSVPVDFRVYWTGNRQGTSPMQPMKRTNLKPLAVILCAAIAFATTSVRPSAAQDTASIIERALSTLTQIDRLIDGNQARNRAASSSQAQNGSEWTSLFDGKSLGGWKQTDFGGGGDVRVEKSFRGGAPAIVVEMGASLSGFNWTGDVPRTNYEIAMEAMKIDGNDFLCGLTFPVADSYASLILGGWGGGVVGISSIDFRDASENDTTQYLGFAKNRWYHVRMRVTPAKLEAWLDDKKIVDQVLAGHKIGLRAGDISRSKPLGISTYQTAAAYRDIRIRRLAP